MVSECGRETPQDIIRGKVALDALFNETPGSDTMVLLTWDKKSIIVCIRESMNLPMAKNTSMAWNYSVHIKKLVSFHGIHKATFYCHLKESEFQFNYRDQNIYQLLLKLMKN